MYNVRAFVCAYSVSGSEECLNTLSTMMINTVVLCYMLHAQGAFIQSHVDHLCCGETLGLSQDRHETEVK